MRGMLKGRGTSYTVALGNKMVIGDVNAQVHSGVGGWRLY